MRKVKVWDPIIRLFHWSVVLTFVANAWAIDDESKLHQQVGWLIVALLGLRVLWGLVGTQHARFSDFPRSIRRPCVRCKISPQAACITISAIPRWGRG